MAMVIVLVIAVRVVLVLVIILIAVREQGLLVFLHRSKCEQLGRSHLLRAPRAQAPVPLRPLAIRAKTFCSPRARAMEKISPARALPIPRRR